MHPRRASESRKNALWGSGRTDKRANALWGRGGRGSVVALVATLTMVLPLAAGAVRSQGPGKDHESYVSPGLLEQAKKNPGRKLHVIVQSDLGALDADAKVKGLGAGLRRRLGLIGAIAIDMPAGALEALARRPGLTITPDARVRLSDIGELYSKQLWPYVTRNAFLWGSAYRPAPQAPTIAVVDSGVDATASDFGTGRVLPQVNLTSLTPNAPGDGRGHGTMVAAVAAGSAQGRVGAAPNARILSIDVMNDKGIALTSDVVAAAEYILKNKDALNIRVANFSLHSAARNHFYNDPLDRAVEKLWFNGVFVVAAAGNYGLATGPSGVLHAPGNDPFVMTVGATDTGTTFGTADDTRAPWSAYGYTEDGFSKPEISAPGRAIIGAVGATATLATERPDHVVAPGLMRLSGTSFSAPMVAGAAAQLLARHPSWTPDRVKGALMVAAIPLPLPAAGSIGVGELNAASASWRTSAPDPNAGLEKFVATLADGSRSFDAVSWSEAVKSSASWNDASWNDASWNDASWSLVSWSELAFSAASWGESLADASLADASWAEASWADASWGESVADSAEGDTAGPDPDMDAAAWAALQAAAAGAPEPVPVP